MFTGIVQDIGMVTAIVKNGDWRLTIKTSNLALAKNRDRRVYMLFRDLSYGHRQNRAEFRHRGFGRNAR